MLNLSEHHTKQLKKKQYGIYEHSAVQICSWTKKAIRKQGTCYKDKFYNVHTHRCMEMTPLSLFCENNCIYCWRPMEYMKLPKLKDLKLSEPKEIVENLLEERKKLLIGFKGNDKVDKTFLEEALNPDHYAISLSGEPTLYPLLPELVKYLKEDKKARTVFIVTNGMEPQMIKELDEKDALPTQLYVSLSAPDKDKFKKINVSLYKDGWDKLMKTFDIVSKIDPKKTRKVIRITLIKGMNDSKEDIEHFKEIMDNSDFDFAEIKSYMHIGYSMKRLSKENQYDWESLKNISKEFESEKFTFEDEQKESLIVLLKNKESIHDKYIYPKEN